MRALLLDGERLPITAMFDCNQDETDDPDLAVAVVAVLMDGMFYATQCRRDEIVDVKVN